jgi:putative chitinase
MDLNWDTHPFRVCDAGFNASMCATMRDIVKFYEGTMFWANEWSDPKDAMHHQMGYGSWGDPDKLADFIKRKIRSDGFSTYKRGQLITVAPKESPDAAAVLAEAMGNSLSSERYAALQPAVSACLRDCGCITVDRIAMWCAQIGHESGGLQWMQEIADGSAYEGRDDLGNNQPGDGRRFKGHGPIQVTGRRNHEVLSQWAFGKGLCPTPTYFVDNPDELASDKYGFTGVTWYWTTQRAMNQAADAKDVETATRYVNGGLNGIQDRTARYDKAIGMGDRLLALVSGSGVSSPVAATVVPVMAAATAVTEKVLPYNHAQQSVAQEKFFDCCPASVQIVLNGLGIEMSEDDLIRAIGTTTDGTNTVEQALPILNQKTAGKYVAVWLPNDPPRDDQREALWHNVKGSIDAGFGCVLNFEVPSTNFPRGTRGSASPQYRGQKVWHYVSCMGYADDGPGGRHLWIADPGFPPFDKGGYWMSLEQVATAIPPHAYAYATMQPALVAQPQPVAPQPIPAPQPVQAPPVVTQVTAVQPTQYVPQQPVQPVIPAGQYASRSGYRNPGEGSIGNADNITVNDDAMVHTIFVEWSAVELGDIESIYRIARSAAGRGADTSPQFIKRAKAALAIVPRNALADTLTRIESVEPDLLRALTGATI